jgi:hypothetical protein
VKGSASSWAMEHGMKKSLTTVSLVKGMVMAMVYIDSSAMEHGAKMMMDSSFDVSLEADCTRGPSLRRRHGHR